MRIVLVVSYDGTSFYGWQCQKDRRTVQEEIEKALSEVLKRSVRVTASGRTDAGVHALGQVCHFDAESSIPPEKFGECLNQKLPADVKVLYSYRAEDDFDCNRQAKRKTYRYSLYLSDKTQPLKERYAVKYSLPLDRALMERAASLLEGEHDFKAFCAAGSQVKTTVRTVYEIRMEERASRYGTDLDIFVTGNGFLYNMVRSIVGFLLEIGSGRLSTERLARALQEGDRSLIGRTMPAKGLTLYSVEYES